MCGPNQALLTAAYKTLGLARVLGHVIYFQAAKMRPIDAPGLTILGGEGESALAGADPDGQLRRSHWLIYAENRPA